MSRNVGCVEEPGVRIFEMKSRPFDVASCVVSLDFSAITAPVSTKALLGVDCKVAMLMLRRHSV